MSVDKKNKYPLPSVDLDRLLSPSAASDRPETSPVHTLKDSIHDVVVAVLEKKEGPLQINEEAILKHAKTPEKAKEYLVFAKALLPHLPEHEREAFAHDPVHFTSDTVVFRGLGSGKYDQLKESKMYPVQNGEMGSRAVFLSNRPFGAITYQHHGAVAIIPRDRLRLMNANLGILKPGSPQYKEESDKLRAAGVSVWEIDNHMDLSNPVATHPQERYLNMRLEQPIEVTEVFLVWKDGIIVEELPQAVSQGSENRAA